MFYNNQVEEKVKLTPVKQLYNISRCTELLAFLNTFNDLNELDCKNTSSGGRLVKFYFL